jgi:hypothetical protein
MLHQDQKIIFTAPLFAKSELAPEKLNQPLRWVGNKAVPYLKLDLSEDELSQFYFKKKLVDEINIYIKTVIFSRCFPDLWNLWYKNKLNDNKLIATIEAFFLGENRIEQKIQEIKKNFLEEIEDPVEIKKMLSFYEDVLKAHDELTQGALKTLSLYDRIQFVDACEKYAVCIFKDDILASEDTLKSLFTIIRPEKKMLSLFDSSSNKQKFTNKPLIIGELNENKNNATVSMSVMTLEMTTTVSSQVIFGISSGVEAAAHKSVIVPETEPISELQKKRVKAKRPKDWWEKKFRDELSTKIEDDRQVNFSNRKR